MTIKQEQLLSSFLGTLDPVVEQPLYQELAACLVELGYSPHKLGKAALSFKCKQHNKQLAKLGIKTSKKAGSWAFFALRFSGCKDYSQRFTDIVAANIVHFPHKIARCMTPDGCCYCGGLADTHVYTFDGKHHCGAYVLEIPNITPNDITEIKQLIQEEHYYLLLHEAGVTP